MSSHENEFISNAQSLTGLPMQQAGETLLAIENHVAHLRAHSRHTLGSLHIQSGLAQPASANPPTIQDLERYAPEYASLVPADPKLRAALALLISDKYLFTYRSVPYLRQTLGFDDDAVKQAFRQYYHQDIATIFAPEITQREHLLWTWSTFTNRLENLPPFWTVFALTLTETVGATVLALPIALAGVGPIAGVLQLVLLGIVNILTIAAMCEAITRNGSMRYGNNFFGHLVKDALGQAGLVIFTPALLSLVVLVLILYYVGLATTLANATGISAPVWAVLMLLVQLYFLRRGSISSTIASAMIVGAINIGLILVIVILALPHLRAENLGYFNAALVDGKSFDPSILSLVFGTILAAYFGHFSSHTCARIVLRRDPSGRSLYWGAITAMAVSIVVYCIFVITVNGSISPARLINETGTVLTPLAEVAGPIILIVGSILAILGMGMASIHFAFALYNQVREWLPPTQPGLRWLRLAPIVGVFLLVEGLLITNAQSFTGILSFLGTLSVPLLSGIFPIAVFASARRKGDYVPKQTLRWLGHPLVIAFLYLIFLGTIFLHAFIIWQDSRRYIALLIGIVVVIATIVWYRRGSFAPRLVVELRVNRGHPATGEFNVTANGKPMAAEVVLKFSNNEQRLTASQGQINSMDDLRTATFQLAVKQILELKVWAHRVTQQEMSVGVPAHIKLNGAHTSQEWKTGADGINILPIDDQTLELKINLDDTPK